MSIVDLDRVYILAAKLIIWAQSRGVDWGSVPDWLAGLGAVFALSFAAWAARSAHVTNKIQGIQLARLEAHEQDRENREQREQASRIAVWLEIKPYKELIKERQERLAVCYSNTSGLPVYNVQITPYVVGRDAARSYKVDVLPPTTEVAIDERSSKLLQDDIAAWAAENLLTSGSDSGDRKEEVSSTQYEMARQLFRKYGVSIQFDDCHGSRWERDAKGRLSPLAEDNRTNHWLL